MSRRPAPLWPVVALAILIAMFAFVLSFDALRAVALACGVAPALAWMFPLVVDGSTLAFTWAAWAFRTRAMSSVYPWTMLVAFTLVSLAGNALHAHPVASSGLSLPDWAPPLIMTVPPAALLATTHMIVMAAGRALDAPPEPEPAGEEPEADAPAPSPAAPERPAARVRDAIPPAPDAGLPVDVDDNRVTRLLGLPDA